MLSATPLIRESGLAEEDITSDKVDGALLAAADDDEDGAVTATAATRGRAVKKPGCLSMSSASSCSAPVAAPVWMGVKMVRAGSIEFPPGEAGMVLIRGLAGTTRLDTGTAAGCD
ncbi:hypothetical protein Vretimale_3447 [Volvox reticuliferus]|uniref:Uncharacterized protein n=1 Tax=Volvox reticuliferus TaxID=1737510 RepID=A0A8J4G1L3_9CHLO|nr:hypothetical protein Vretimale_3447 [Volvox reticuliferus]